MKPLEFLKTPERFLPLKPAALLARLLEDPRLSAPEREQFAKLFEMIGARFHFEFRGQLERLKTLYDPFDPDRDTLPLGEPSAEEMERQRSELRDELTRLLLEANYVEMPRPQLHACLKLQGEGGVQVKVNLDEYREVAIFYRGIHEQERTYRHWLLVWRKRTRRVPVISRTVVLVRPQQDDDPRIHVKLFKDILVSDLKMVLPKVRICMHWLDQVKIGSSVLGGLVTAVWKAVSAAILSPYVFLVMMAGLIGAAVKGVYSFLASKTRYMQTLSTNLYFQNLANNTSAVALLVDSAEAEEIKELMLAYFLLYVERDRDFTAASLDRRCEEWVRQRFGLEVDFEVADALRKLHAKGLLAYRRVPSPTVHQPASQRMIFKVLDLPSALRRLDEVWDKYFEYTLPETTSTADRLANGNWPPFPESERSEAA